MLLPKKEKEWKNGKQKMRIFGEKKSGELGLENLLVPMLYCPLMCAPIDVQIFLFMALFAVHLTADSSHYPPPGDFGTSRS